MRGMNDTDEVSKTAALIVLQSPVLLASLEQWQRVSESLSLRLVLPVALLVVDQDADTIEAEYQSTLEWYVSQGYQRFVVLPIGLEDLDLQSLRSAIAWIQQSGVSVAVHLADSWSIADWCEAIAASVVDSSVRTPSPESLLLWSSSETSATVGFELASLVHLLVQEESQLHIRFGFDQGPLPRLSEVFDAWDREGVHDCVLVPWRMEQREAEESIARIGVLHGVELETTLPANGWRWNRLTRELHSINILEHPSWLHIAIAKYLDGLSRRALGSTDNGLMQLERRVDALLPSEYRGKTEEVSTKSMGTASLPSQEFGQVPWDEIWTSFCDLAMAGGPPHRGTLLEAVTAEQASRDMRAYEQVVKEIRRGIELATGMATVESRSLGWVGVDCQSEPMAVWLMRAILVENVMVRREGTILYLPAGPEFAVKREIKNVITSVAKAAHYWKSHLKQNLQNVQSTRRS